MQRLNQKLGLLSALPMLAVFAIALLAPLKRFDINLRHIRQP